MATTLQYHDSPDGRRADAALRRPVYLAMFLFVWLPAALFFTGIISCMSGVFVSLLGVIVGPGVALFLVYAIRRNQKVWHERRAAAILGYVENAVRLNLPLDKFLTAAEAGEDYLTSRSLAHIRVMLNRGLLVGEALAGGAPEVSDRVTRELVAAEQIGQLQPALTRIVAQTRRDRPTQYEDNIPFYRFYLVIVGFALLFVACGTLVFVIPKFRDIFKDFRVPLPPVTQAFINVSDFMANDTPLGFLLAILLLLVMLAAIARLMQHVFTPSMGNLLPQHVAEWVAWHTPFWRGLQRNRALGDVFEYLGDAVAAGVPLPLALDQAETLQMNYHMRDRLEKWKETLVAGRSPAQGAREARMPELLVGLLEAGETPRASAKAGGAAGGVVSGDMFGFLARYYRERFSRLLVTLRAGGEPLLVLTMGLLVGTFVYAMYSPLVALILSVAPGVDGNGVL